MGDDRCVEDRQQGGAQARIVHLALGSVTAGARWVADAAGGSAAARDDREPGSPDPRYVVLGAAAVVEEQLRGTVARVSALARPPTALALRMIPPGVRRAAASRLQELDVRGRVEAESGAEETSRMVTGIADELVRSPAVLHTIREVVDQILWPVIDEVIPVVLERLAKEPEQIRVIVQSQSHGMLEEITETARNRAAGADEAADRLVARLLRRRSVHTTPPPPPPLAPPPGADQPLAVEP